MAEQIRVSDHFVIFQSELETQWNDAWGLHIPRADTFWLETLVYSVVDRFDTIGRFLTSGEFDVDFSDDEMQVAEDGVYLIPTIQMTSSFKIRRPPIGPPG
jgi:hypothetical protein